MTAQQTWEAIRDRNNGHLTEMDYHPVKRHREYPPLEAGEDVYAWAARVVRAVDAELLARRRAER